MTAIALMAAGVLIAVAAIAMTGTVKLPTHHAPALVPEGLSNWVASWPTWVTYAVPQVFFLAILTGCAWVVVRTSGEPHRKDPAPAPRHAAPPELPPSAPPPSFPPPEPLFGTASGEPLFGPVRAVALDSAWHGPGWDTIEFQQALVMQSDWRRRAARVDERQNGHRGSEARQPQQGP